ncbi:transmembrane protein 231-like [Tubulanus polymorphus]|uniref:transmembrane protein 231-like n=1 Tax=Tubulanus polymorphus TaxID=672921 RepID=UPI003DA59C6A
MAMLEIYNHPEVRRYKAHFCSKATFFIIFISLVSFIAPFFVVYKSFGFWKKTDVYKEQLQVKFQHNIILFLETPNGYLTWSTYNNFNKMQQNNLRVPLIKSREVDKNGDGINDYLSLNLQVPLADSEQIYGVKLLLTFYSSLMLRPLFYMQSLGYVNHESRLPGADFSFISDLVWVQKTPLKHQGTDIRYDSPPIDGNSAYVEAFDLQKIFYDYQQRNVSTRLENIYPVWMSGRGSGQPFTINGTIIYPTPTVEIYTGFWQTLKWGFIQYMPVLIVFLYGFNQIKWFIFNNHLFPCVVDNPLKSHQQ